MTRGAGFICNTIISQHKLSGFHKSLYYQGYPRHNAVSADFLEPVCTGGHLVAPLGFSVGDRTCTPKQEKVPVWVRVGSKKLLPITCMAGVSPVLPSTDSELVDCAPRQRPHRNTLRISQGWHRGPYPVQDCPENRNFRRTYYRNKGSRFWMDTISG